MTYNAALIKCVDCKSFPNSCGYWKSKRKEHTCAGFVPAEEMNLKETIYALSQMDIRRVLCNSQVIDNAVFFLKHPKLEEEEETKVS